MSDPSALCYPAQYISHCKPSCASPSHTLPKPYERNSPLKFTSRPLPLRLNYQGWPRGYRKMPFPSRSGRSSSQRCPPAMPGMQLRHRAEATLMGNHKLQHQKMCKSVHKEEDSPSCLFLWSPQISVRQHALLLLLGQ